MFSKKQIFGVLAAAALVTSMVGAPAHASTLLVTAGTLDFDPAGAPVIGNYSGVTLNGTPQLTSLTIAPFTIVDATGSALGWNVQPHGPRPRERCIHHRLDPGLDDRSGRPRRRRART